ncbi:DUF7660 family protein [Streptosporangium sp. KLBMP 9127]|nr:hypothetical protein [Streptosporangium sp. KLBMP 9127]
MAANNDDKDSLEEVLLGVHSKEDLSDFILELRESMTGEPDSWENLTLDNYLEAMSAWLHDSDLPSEIVTSGPSWQFIAEILIAAAIYE